MNENIRKTFLSMLESLSENRDYRGRITKVDTKFSIDTLTAFLSYYALNSSGLNGEGKEYLLSGTELFNLLNSSSIGLEEIWNLIEIINKNSCISVSSQKKFVIPSFSIDLNREGTSLSFEKNDWENVGKLIQDLEKSHQSNNFNSEDEFVVIDLNRVFGDMNKMLVLLKKSKVDESHIQRTINKTKPQECSFVLRKLYNVLGFECEDEENCLYHGLNDINKGFVEGKDRAKSDFDISQQGNSLSLGLTKCIEELKFNCGKEIEDKNMDNDENPSSKSDNDSENLDHPGIKPDVKEFDSESEGLDNSDNDIDYFEDVPGDVSDIKYKDFYKDLDDRQLGNREINSENDMSEIDDEISSEENYFTEHELEEPKSAFELKEEKKKRKITELEEDLLKSKPWTLQGEVDSTQRPFNSLLEEVVEVDLSQRPPPVITKKRTKKLHNIICEIIVNKSFDDVERKQRPVSNVNEFKNKIVLDQEKSKLSLAQIYEKEYLKEMENKNTEEKEETESAEKKEIKELMYSVTTKLQALSNLHFIPKPAMPELRIVSNLPAVAVEEIAPIVTSHEKLLAPEEISGTSKRLTLDKEERTATDKKRERRKKKLLQKHRAKRTERNANFISTKGKKHNKNTEELNQSRDIKLKSSKSFFESLQERQEIDMKLQKSSEVQNNPKMKKNKKRKPDGIEPKKIKL